MSEIDIRNNKVATIEYIRFADLSEEEYKATRIRKGKYESVAIEEDDYTALEPQDVRIVSAAHAKDLIAALEKAIELGWLV